MFIFCLSEDDRPKDFYGYVNKVISLTYGKSAEQIYNGINLFWLKWKKDALFKFVSIKNIRSYDYL